MTEAWDPEVPMGDRRGRFPVALTVLTLLAMALLIGLGAWQLQRMYWKRDVLARIAALEAAPARPVGAVLARRAAGADVDFTRVTIACPGLARAPFVELYGLREGQAGSRLISACPVTGAGPYRTVLVDRGFVGDTISARPPVDAADAAPVTIVGVLRSPEAASVVTPPNRARQFFSRDVAAMAKALGAPAPAPVFLLAETSSNPEWAGLVAAPLPATISNRHLEYALTWFGLAAALAGVYAAVLLKRRKG
ncbi:SURF1 family protein [Phenylobacterium sp.]|jgi:surfeit locus 1 family protein|uniref:SURF1 family protein n=1 Tax=Phenylobacterium sp. TaxID=1871053 RepID=UPI003783284C